MDVAVAVLLGQLGGMLASLVEIDTVRHDLSAKAPNRAHLDRVRPLRHAHDGAHAEDPRGVGDRLPVVPG